MSMLTADERAHIDRLLPGQLSAAILDNPSTQTFSDATDWLRKRIDALSHFVPAPVVRHLLADGAPGQIYGTYWHGSLLFADLSGFTALSEHLAGLGKEGSEEITRIINRMFMALVEEIERHGGDLIKFGGDALTAFFDADLLGSHHAEWATNAAQQMQQRMTEVGQVTTRRGDFTLRLRIGVHSGRAFAALLGDDEHQELLLTGDDVNLVARAQEIARPGEVVVSAATLTELEHVYTLPRDYGFAALQAISATAPPGAPVPLIYPPDTNDREELLQLLRTYAAIRLFLPQRLTERQLISADDLTMGGFRLVAVLFAHIAPFSELLRHLDDDPQAATLLINRYYQQMQQIVSRFGGTVNKLDMAADGDKLLAIFGAPITHENDAELALRAALAMQEAMNEINADIQISYPMLPLLDQQIGLNQGHVFAGLVGSAHRREYTVMGDPVNLAARLMIASPGGDILVSPAVARASSTDFEFETLPPISLKGKADAISPARIVRAYHTRRDTQRAPLVGRIEELARLRETAVQALRGRGQIVVIKGEAGIGKSRLLEELLHWLTLTSFDDSAGVPAFTPLSVECQFYEQTTPYASTRDILRPLLRIQPGNDSAHAIETVERRVGELAPHLVRFTPLLGPVLNLPLVETALTQALTPDQRHQRTLDLLETLFHAIADQTPLVILWDDVHWIDASSRELIERLGQHIRDVPLLLLLSYRLDPPIPEPWAEQSAIIEVSELSNAERLELASAILGGAVPPTLVERWDGGDDTFFNPQGNPFFLEELLHALLEQQVIVERNGNWTLQGSMDALPTTIEGVITARLDRLEARYRETVQVASVVGRRFQMAILDGVTDGQDMSQHMRVLAQADLVLRDQLAAEMAYLFKHTMTRDVAYEGILYARRRELHRRVAHRIETLYSDNLDDVLPIVARHYARAEDWMLAINYYTAAGRRAQQGYFNHEAITLFEEAIRLLPQVPALQPGVAIELYERLGYSQLQTCDYDAALDGLHEALRRIQATSDVNTESIARILRHIATVHERRTEYDMAFEQLKAALNLLGNNPSLERVRALLLGAGLHQRLGHYPDAIDWATQGLRLSEILDVKKEQANAYLLLGGCNRLLGNNEQAIQDLYHSIDLYQEVNDIARLADAYNNTAIALGDIGKWAESLALYNAAYEIKVQINDVYGQALVLLNLGEVHRKMSSIDVAVDMFQRSLTHWNTLGSKLGAAVTLMNLGATFLEQGQIDAAQDHLDQSNLLYANIGTESYLPELYRIYTRLLLHQHDYAQAQLSCQQAIIYARKLEAKGEEGLAELLHGQILIALQQPAAALDATQRALELLDACDNQHDILACLDQMIEFLGPDARSKDYRERAATLRDELRAYV